MAIPTTAPGRVGEVRFKKETVGSPAAAISDPATYWAASPKKVRAFDVDVGSLKYESEDDQAIQVNAFGDPAKFLTAKGGAMPFKIYMPGLNQTAADATLVTQDDIGDLLTSALGGVLHGTSTTVAAASGPGATTPLKVASAGTFAIGAALMVNGEARRITAISGTDLTLDQDLSSTPSLGTLVKAASTYFPDQDMLGDLNDAGHQTLAMLFRGYHPEDQYQARGCFPEIEFASLGSGKIAQLEVTPHILGWELVTGVAIGTLATEAAPPAQINSGLYMRPSGTVTPNKVYAKSVDIKLGLKPEPIEAPSGENGVIGHIVTGGRTTLSFEAPYDSEWNIGYEARTVYVAGYQIGTGVLISLPNLTVDMTPERVGGQSNTGIKVSMHADWVSGGTTDLARARFAIHRFAR